MKPAQAALEELLRIMARLRAPDGCPWDREQDHRSIRFHAVEEVYEMIDAIEAGDDHELEEELGDLLLQVVFHCQLASERKAFDFARVARRISQKLLHRHPHVFGEAKVKSVAAVWTQWEKLKREEKRGTGAERHSALDGIPRHLPALLYAEKLAKKARKAGLGDDKATEGGKPARTKTALARLLFELAAHAQKQGWNAEELLRAEALRRERRWRAREKRGSPTLPAVSGSRHRGRNR
jgi:uncharacterized protein YabN with tetrapyrrole methylase and pyrophosphatase domain